MVIFLIAAVAAAAAVAEVVFEGDVGGAVLQLGGGDVALGPVAVLVVDALGLAGVDVGVVPEGEGGEGRHGVVGVVEVADGGKAFVVVFAGAVVEGEDLRRGWISRGNYLVGRCGGKGKKELTPLLETHTISEE